MSPKRAAARPLKRSGARFDECCSEWTNFPAATKTWRWHVVHRLAHSRTTFSVNTVALMGQLSTEEARTVVNDAVNFGWVKRVEDQPEGIYVGKLFNLRGAT